MVSRLRTAAVLMSLAATLAACGKAEDKTPPVGTLAVSLPDGRKLLFRGSDPGPEGTLLVKTFAFARRLVRGGDIGFAEAYIRGEWDSPDVAAFLELFSANHDIIATMLGHAPIVRAWQAFRHWMNRNSRAGSRPTRST